MKKRKNNYLDEILASLEETSKKLDTVLEIQEKNINRLDHINEILTKESVLVD